MGLELWEKRIMQSGYLNSVLKYVGNTYVECMTGVGKLKNAKAAVNDEVTREMIKVGEWCCD